MGEVGYKTLAIDIETFSDVDLIKCGVYAYADSPVAGSISGYQKQLHSIGKHRNRESEKGSKWKGWH